MKKILHVLKCVTSLQGSPKMPHFTKKPSIGKKKYLLNFLSLHTPFFFGKVTPFMAK